MGQWFNSTFEQYSSMNNKAVKCLIQLKNASIYNKSITLADSNMLVESILVLLYHEGFIQSFRLKNDVGFNSKKALITLRANHEKPIFSNLKIISTPAKQKYYSLAIICRLPVKNVLFVFSTSQGLLTHHKCIERGIGGVLLFMS